MNLGEAEADTSLRHILLIGERLEKRDERFFILAAEPDAGGWMLGEVGIKRGTSAQVVIVMLDDFFERLEAPIVHVGRGEGNVAQAGRGEFVEVTFVLSHTFTTGVRLDG